jgi:hypothetical protein
MATANTAVDSSQKNYRELFSLDERKRFFKQFKDNTKDSNVENVMPVILESLDENLIEKIKNNKSNDKKQKYAKLAVNPQYTVTQFHFYVRNKYLTLKPDESCILFVESPSGELHLPAGKQLMSQIQNEYQHEDGMLYFKIKNESTFG